MTFKIKLPQLLLWLAISYCCGGCAGKTSDTPETIHENSDKLPDPSTITMPDKTEKYFPPDYVGLDSIIDSNSPYRILVFMNFSCPTCIPQSDQWNNFYTTKVQQYHIPLTLVCISDEKFRHMRYLFKYKKIKSFPTPLILDIENKYMKLNPGLVFNGVVRTVLVDSAYKILYIGNPIDNNEDEKGLIATIQNLKIRNQ